MGKILAGVVSKTVPGEWEIERDIPGEFQLWRPTPSQAEGDQLGATPGDIPMLKVWDLSPIDESSFDPTEPPGRPPPAAPPVNIAPPNITVLTTLEVGQDLISTNGTWTGAAPITYTRQWQRGANPIAGATGISYILVTADVGQLISCVVTARTAEGGTASSAATPVGPATVARPVNNTPPVVAGNPIVGATLTRTNGTWSGAPTYATQWKANGTNIPGATGATYILTAGEVGTTVGVTVTATNGGGSVPMDSNTVGPITTTAEDPGDGEAVQPTRKRK
jgi:hypothetical protein